MVKLPVFCPLKKIESFSTCTLTRDHQLWRATFSILITILRVLFGGFLL